MEQAVKLPVRLAVPSLSESKAARLVVVAILYFMQGVPAGLSTVGISSWLAANGATPTEVGAFVGIALLPWSLKLVNGLLMDRFTFRPMGRRRVWIITAQAMMVIALLAMAMAAPTVDQIGLLAAFCFALNLCATFNDVAVDGMAVDLVPDEERTMVNGLMSASQALGISAASFVAGQLLMSGDIASTALVFAAFVAIVSSVVVIFRERPGERLLPWSKGSASRECEERQHSAWLPIIAGIFRSIVSPLTILFLMAVFLVQVNWAFIDAVTPTLAVQQLGWGSDKYSSFSALVSLIAAVAAGLLSPLIVRLVGLRNAIGTLFVLVGSCAVIGGATFDSWQGDRTFMIVFAAQYVLSLLLMILLVVWAMRICNPAVAASQFALFMAVPNLARSVMSGNSGWLVESGGYAVTYYTVAAITLVALAICLLAKVGNPEAVPEAALPKEKFNNEGEEE
ncbi:MFS transporter [Sphingorhabdus sp. Alg231-15]|uniref:MFS transporter n=1 Tax=Sphingorhabdus sp. Alg231-15 TaxID=1922222 RepID=UPI000D54B9FD